MEVDPCPSTSELPSQCTALMPVIDEDSITEFNSKTRLMEILDKLEQQVENLRKGAVKMEEEKDRIMSHLDAVKMLPQLNDLTGLEKDEANTYLERIIDRCNTVDIQVYTQRDSAQQDSLSQVNFFIDTLVVSVKTDPEGARNRCITYMNACSSQFSGISDKMFESALLGCTIDDQKRVKKRLQGLLKYLDRLPLPYEV